MSFYCFLLQENNLESHFGEFIIKRQTLQGLSLSQIYSLHIV